MVTIPIVHECDSLTGTITKVVSFTWTGTLTSAILAGQFSCDLVGIFLGSARGEVRVNGTVVWSQLVNAPFSNHVTAGPFSVDVANWLVQGGNKFEFAIIQTSGAFDSLQECADVDCTVIASGTVTPPSPPLTPISWTSIVLIIVVVLVLAVAAGLFLRAER